MSRRPTRTISTSTLKPANVLTLWLALADVDQENGCLHYVPRSHLGGCRPHESSQVLGFSQRLVDYGPQDQNAEVAVPLSANDLVAHHGWTIHRADANRSTTRHRPSLAMVFRGVSCQLDTDGQRHYQESLRQQQQARDTE